MRVRGRPRKTRIIQFQPSVTFFKPAGIPLRDLEIIQITREEIEALRLSHLQNLGQKEASDMMGISQPTLNRTLDSVYKKITQAMTSGCAIRIEE